MDPNANLNEQRRLAAHLMEAIENERDVKLQDALRLSELVIALDNWITGGGAAPTAWARLV